MSKKLHAAILIIVFFSCHVYAARQFETGPSRVHLQLTNSDDGGNYDITPGVDYIYVEHTLTTDIQYYLDLPVASTASDVIVIITDQEGLKDLTLTFRVQTDEYLNATQNGTQNILSTGSGETTIVCPLTSYLYGAWSICTGEWAW